MLVKDLTVSAVLMYKPFPEPTKSRKENPQKLTQLSSRSHPGEQVHFTLDSHKKSTASLW